MPFSKNEVAHYEKKRYRGLDQRIVHNREQNILAKLWKKIGFSHGLALDMPCGYGRFSGFVQERGLALVNCDLSPAMVERACEKIGKLGSPGVVADATAGLPFKPGSFDVVLSMRLFHHLHRTEDRLAVLEEFFRVSTGSIVLSYYRANALHKVQRVLRRTLKKTPTRIKMLSKGTFQEELRKAGLTAVCEIPLFRGIHSQHVVLLEKARTRA